MKSKNSEGQHQYASKYKEPCFPTQPAAEIKPQKQTLEMHVHNILNTLGKPAVYNVMKINWTTKSLSLKMALMFTLDIWSTISLERTLLNKFT